VVAGRSRGGIGDLMRININLASQPYEVAREYTRRLGLLTAALAVLTAALIGYIFYQRAHTRDIDQKIQATRQELNSLDAEKARADQSQFLNNLFARKALSWTKVFTEMEKIMPSAIHVVSMKPEFNHDNQLVLHVVVATDSRDKAVELVKRMEKSPHFHAPQVEAETAMGQGPAGPAGGNIQFDIAAVYVPFADEPAETPAEESEKSAAVAQTPAKPGAGRPVAQNALAHPGGVR